MCRRDSKPTASAGRSGSSPNDIRRRENETPIAEGDTYHQPANWVPLGTTSPVATRAKRKTVESYDKDGRIKSMIEEEVA